MIHLVVIQPNVSVNAEPSQVSCLYNPNRYDFRWNADFTAFEVLPLKWWDDASYLAYQSDCGDYAPDTVRDEQEPESYVPDNGAECAWQSRYIRCETAAEAAIPF